MLEWDRLRRWHEKLEAITRRQGQAHKSRQRKSRRSWSFPFKLDCMSFLEEATHPR